MFSLPDLQTLVDMASQTICGDTIEPSRMSDLWSREFWYLFLRNKWMEKATEEDKSKMEMGLQLVCLYAWQLLEHVMNPILLLPGNIVPEEEYDVDDSSVVLTEDQDIAIVGLIRGMVGHTFYLTADLVAIEEKTSIDSDHQCSPYHLTLAIMDTNES
ncbi:hypothetical protein EDD18DRAFT_1108463 [Armillaria luteobubalina]|uniref:Uncharacterized protein n=1 Tax=Armillaria luteobubalina TaxID=153913 RepID=A0AA39TKG4_9AGAR|nr:hypothetical protein EDD18DRAFT_1108463 [Armillaria luteobubalina]